MNVTVTRCTDLSCLPGVAIKLVSITDCEKSVELWGNRQSDIVVRSGSDLFLRYRKEGRESVTVLITLNTNEGHLHSHSATATTITTNSTFIDVTQLSGSTGVTSQ